ncbi:Inosine/uridine-preferring nucleoside hydrolase domain-containing protein [Calycina marina]|uniref:Inosine/uridine-preferring nucleoside hydrolase domain-containing protein n=1 Tax=Calycina marina TaxID=1763456 RepID=A0A9P8CBL1_9HELO|nr:Inosine/uridine-preferring nucleoside hydrolase domain-containing protein [Calycina marina]
MMEDGTEQIHVWLDCDPGHDDAFAILLAAHLPSIKLIGISTVYGNASLARTTYNALSILTAMGKTDVPVYSGASSGLVRPEVHAPDIHGESGLDGTDLLPVPTAKAKDKPAVEAMAEALLKCEAGTTWVVATGATTNVAQLFMTYPDLAIHVKGLSIMGGAIGGGYTNVVMGKVGDIERIGNWSQWAEFNILIDPEAAASLFDNPILAAKTVLTPLDVTHQVLATADIQDLLLHGKGCVKGKTTLRTMLVELLTFFAKTYADVFGITEGPPLHDPLAVAVCLDGIVGAEIPFFDFVEGGKRERYKVQIITEGSHDEAHAGAETGRTVATLLPDGQEGVKIPRGLDVARFWSVVEDCMERADKINRDLA